MQALVALVLLLRTSACLGPYKESDEKIYHAYYQWVPLMLFLQAVMFYAPHWIWKQLEGGRMKVLVGRGIFFFHSLQRHKLSGMLSSFFLGGEEGDKLFDITWIRCMISV